MNQKQTLIHKNSLNEFLNTLLLPIKCPQRNYYHHHLQVTVGFSISLTVIYFFKLLLLLLL
jgi:hypothetical protein